jgi:hypothetical protein
MASSTSSALLDLFITNLLLSKRYSSVVAPIILSCSNLILSPSLFLAA